MGFRLGDIESEAVEFRCRSNIGGKAVGHWRRGDNEVKRCIFIEASRPRSDTPHSVGLL